MEAFALLKIQKKNKELARLKALGLEEAENALVAQANASKQVKQLSKEELEELNRSIGFPIPPKQVYAIGKPGSAAVWWSISKDDDNLTGWEVHRYRKDGGEWNYKGFLKVEIECRNQVIVGSLTDDKEYRFTVKGVNAKGASAESDVSNPVVVEHPLPAGWFRFYSDQRHRFYYANIRTQQSSWERPEKDPYFLEESVMMNFHAREIKHLRELYQEEIDHFRAVTSERMQDVLSECGETVGNRRVTQLFREYCKNDFKCYSWKDFMDVMNHIKRDKLYPNAALVEAASAVTNVLQNTVVAQILGPRKKKLGDWEVAYNNFAERTFYYNTRTHEKQWDLPDEVRFYIPDVLLNKLLDVFDYGHLENFKYQFTMIDVDNSGDVTEVEMKILLKSMGLDVDDGVVRKLVRTIDLNGNGLVEFDEFCYMMYCLRMQATGMDDPDDPGTHAAIWRELDINNYAKKQAELKRLEAEEAELAAAAASGRGRGKKKKKKGAASDYGGSVISSRPSSVGPSDAGESAFGSHAGGNGGMDDISYNSVLTGDSRAHHQHHGERTGTAGSSSSSVSSTGLPPLSSPSRPSVSITSPAKRPSNVPSAPPPTHLMSPEQQKQQKLLEEQQQKGKGKGSKPQSGVTSAANSRPTSALNRLVLDDDERDYTPDPHAVDTAGGRKGIGTGGSGFTSLFSPSAQNKKVGQALLQLSEGHYFALQPLNMQGGGGGMGAKGPLPSAKAFTQGATDAVVGSLQMGRGGQSIAQPIGTKGEVKGEDSMSRTITTGKHAEGLQVGSELHMMSVLPELTGARSAESGEGGHGMSPRRGNGPIAPQHGPPGASASRPGIPSPVRSPQRSPRGGLGVTLDPLGGAGLKRTNSMDWGPDQPPATPLPRGQYTPDRGSMEEAVTPGKCPSASSKPETLGGLGLGSERCSEAGSVAGSVLAVSVGDRAETPGSPPGTPGGDGFSPQKHQPSWLVNRRPPNTNPLADNSGVDSNPQSPNRGRARTESSGGGSTLLGKLTPSAKMQSALMWATGSPGGSVGGEGDPSFSGRFSAGSGPASPLAESLRNVSTRIGTAVADVSRDVSSKAIKTLNVVSAKALELQRAVAEAVFTEEERFVDENGEQHGKSCFCGCRNRRNLGFLG